MKNKLWKSLDPLVLIESNAVVEADNIEDVIAFQLLHPTFLDWVICISDIGLTELPNGECNLSGKFDIVRVPKNVTDEEINSKMEELNRFTSTIISDIIESYAQEELTEYQFSDIEPEIE